MKLHELLDPEARKRRREVFERRGDDLGLLLADSLDNMLGPFNQLLIARAIECYTQDGETSEPSVEASSVDHREQLIYLHNHTGVLATYRFSFDHGPPTFTRLL